MSSCEWTFKPNVWEEKTGKSPVATNEQECPCDSIKGRRFCKYHADASVLDSEGLEEESVFLDLLQEEQNILGARFQSICLTGADIRQRDIDSMKLVHTRIHQKLVIEDIKLTKHAQIIGCSIGEVDIRRCQILSGFELAHSVVSGKTTLHKALFGSESKITGNNFQGIIRIESEFEENIGFRQNDCGKSILIENSKFREYVRMYYCNFQEDILIDSSTFSGTLDIKDVGVEKVVYIRDSEVENFKSVLKNSRDTLIKILNSKIISGVILQNNEANTYCDFFKSTLGDMDLQTNANGMDNYHFKETKFENFDFFEYRNDFEEVGWNIHKFAIPVEEFNQYSTDIMGDYGFGIGYQEEFLLKNHEKQYILAKEGANKQGDSKSASELFIQQMKAREKRIRNDHNSNQHGNLAALKYTLGYYKSKFLGITSSYGEKPWKTIVSSVGLIFAFAILYPIVGGFQSTSQASTVSCPLMECTQLPEWVKLTGDGLYFSVVTFTGLGTSNFAPATVVGNFLSGIQSLIGAFFIGYFVFTLGKQLSR